MAKRDRSITAGPTSNGPQRPEKAQRTDHVGARRAQGDTQDDPIVLDDTDDDGAVQLIDWLSDHDAFEFNRLFSGPNGGVLLLHTSFYGFLLILSQMI